MRLIIDDTRLIEKVLIGFLRSLRDTLDSDHESIWESANTPLICPDGEIIRNLNSSTADELKKAWSTLIDIANVSQLLPKASENQITITPALTALAIASYNSLKIHSHADRDKEWEPTKLSGFDYTLKLCQTIPSAADPVAGVLYDSLIDPCCKIWRKNPPKTKNERSLLAALLCINPFSELKNLDLKLPAPLKNLTGCYLVHQDKMQEYPEQSTPATSNSVRNSNHQWWLQAERFILTPPLMRILRDQWLTIPENSLSCTGLGIFLEELRRREKKQFRTPILEFFEAYDYLQQHQTQEESGLHRQHSYQKLAIIQHLLESKNHKLNRKGNAYFLKFRALLEIIAEEQSVPNEIHHLSREFCLQRLAPLSALATIIGGERTAITPSFGMVQYSDEPENNVEQPKRQP